MRGEPVVEWERVVRERWRCVGVRQALRCACLSGGRRSAPVMWARGLIHSIACAPPDSGGRPHAHARCTAWLGGRRNAGMAPPPSDQSQRGAASRGREGATTPVPPRARARPDPPSQARLTNGVADWVRRVVPTPGPPKPAPPRAIALDQSGARLDATVPSWECIPRGPRGAGWLCDPPAPPVTAA